MKTQNYDVRSDDEELEDEVAAEYAKLNLGENLAEEDGFDAEDDEVDVEFENPLKMLAGGVSRED